jgi:hypothetical protein
MRTLREALEHTPTPLLREMARFWEVAGAEKIGRPRLIQGLLEQMARPEVVRRELNRLDREERDALRTVLAAGGRMPAAVLTRTHGPLRPPHLAPEDPAALNPTERLHRRALLFRAYSTWDDFRGLAFFVPAELWAHLPRVPQATPESLLQPLQADEVVATPADLVLHRDMACTLAFFRREVHPLAEDGSLPAGPPQALDELLAPPHPAYSAFLLHLAWQARLLAPDLAGVLRPSAEGQQWLRAAPALRTQVLFQAWRDHPGWDDLAAVPGLLVERRWPADLAAPRGRILRHLAACPAGDWLALSDWAHFVEATDPDFLRASGSPGRPRVRQRETRVLLEGVPSWNKVEGGYLRFVASGPLYWLGLVDLGVGPAEEPAFRLTPLGQALLHPEAAMPELVEEKAIVEGTFEVWVPLEASPYIVFLLEGCAERVRQDRLSQYRLARPALQRAVQRGERVEWLLEALSRYGRGEVPQNVAYTLQEWAAAYGQLHLRRPILLGAADAVLVEEVLADPAVRAVCGERLSPTAVEVDAEGIQALEERLGQLGHLPQVEEGLLPQGEQVSVRLTTAQRTALLALLWTWEEVGKKGERGQALAGLAEALARSLPPAGLVRARRQKERWLKELTESQP